ncbi:hypothetical protein Fmac_026634 [Flemingia macrophylla]|uniref:Plant PDR ABC transporter associated domain-containing protein n=1 Tax=Flemingia macrophylla TaxID=520843 RepID=A0ABD1LFD6_9FABA
MEMLFAIMSQVRCFYDEQCLQNSTIIMHVGYANRRWHWIRAAAALGFTVLYNVLFTIALVYLNPLGKKQAIISKENASEI